MPAHKPQDALLAAILHVLDASRDEEGNLADPEKAMEEFDRIVLFQGEDAERMSLDGQERADTESSLSVVDTIIDRGGVAAVAVADEIRRKVRALAKKKYPPRR